MNDEEFEAYIFSQLEIIDTFLSKEEVDIPDRPFTAADMFVKTSLVSVNDKPPDHYITESWFKYIIRPIRKWYQTKYGAVATLARHKVSKGVVLYNDAFYELDIPLRLIVPKGELREFIFPKEILPFEDELSFVKHPPNFSSDTQETSKFKDSVRKVINLTRSINNNLTTSHFKHQLCHELSEGIEAHIQKTVEDILSNQTSRYLISYWEIHLAIEKSIKVLIVQANKPIRPTHDLIELRNLLNQIRPGLIQSGIIEQFPGHRDVISYRYGNGPTIKKGDVHANYLRALELLDLLTKEFDRKYIFNNTVFVLQKLPWQSV